MRAQEAGAAGPADEHALEAARAAGRVAEG